MLFVPQNSEAQRILAWDLPADRRSIYKRCNKLGLMHWTGRTAYADEDSFWVRLSFFFVGVIRGYIRNLTLFNHFE